MGAQTRLARPGINARGFAGQGVHLSPARTPEGLGISPRPLRSGSLGGVAQLGERLHGMQEVSGSIPLTSTKT